MTGQNVRDPFPNATIPANRIDPIGKKLLDLLPLPTFTDRLAGNYLANPVKTLDDYQGDIRIDHNISNDDRLFGRFSFENAKQYLPTGLPDYGATGGFSSNQTFKTNAKNIAISETHVFKNNLINQATAGYNRVFNYITSFGYLSNKSTEFGIPGANLGTDETSSLTRMTFQNFVGIGDRGFSPFQGGTNVFHYSDTLTMVKGSHTLNGGATARFMQLNLLGDTALAGQFAFTRLFTAGFTPTGTLNANTGNSIASLLLGLPASGGRNDQLQGSTKGRRWQEYRGFVDDTWKVSNTLTMNLGFAYMVTTPQTEAQDRFSNFDFYTGKTYVGGTIGVKTDWSNVQPRIGFAWSPSDQHGPARRLRDLPRRVGDGRIDGPLPEPAVCQRLFVHQRQHHARCARWRLVFRRITSRSIRPSTRGPGRRSTRTASRGASSSGASTSSSSCRRRRC